MQILTAIGNNFIYNKLKTINDFNLYKKDIPYREGILELLNTNSKFDIIIIYEKLQGDISFEELIDKIKIINNDIKIVFLLENKNSKLEKVLINKNIKNIFYNNEINFNDFILKLKSSNEYNYLKIENEKLKKLLQEKVEKKEIVKDRLLVITDISFFEFRKIRYEMQKKMNIKIDYLSFLNIKEKLVNYKKVVFVFYFELNMEKIIFLKNRIESIKNKYSINKINVLFIEKEKINFKIIKNIFKEFNILGEIKVKNKYFINKGIIKKI